MVGSQSPARAGLRAEGFAEATLSSQRAHLRAALSWAKSVGLLGEVPEIPKARMPKGTPHMRGRPITTEEFERMVKAVPKERPKDADAWRRYLQGLWLSGLRIAESLALSWDAEASVSVDLTGRFPALRIQAAAEKGNRDRRLPLTPDFATWLLATPEVERQGFVFKLGSRRLDENMSVKRVSRIVSAIGKAANIIVNKAAKKSASAHDFRRAFGTRWSAKVRAADLQVLMRHASIETTLRFYVGHEADEVAERLYRDNPGGKGDGANNRQCDTMIRLNDSGDCQRE